MESEYTVNQTVSKDKTIVSEAREETRDTLLHRKPESAVERTTHAPSAEGGGGDFVDGADPPQTIGQPCASSSFMSTVDEDTTTPMVVDCDDIAIERISFSLDPVQVACDFEDVTVQPDESPFLEEHLCNNDTNQSYRGDTVFNQTPRLDGYLPNTTNESIDTSLHSTTAGGRGDAGVRGEWSFLGSSMLDDFAGVSDHLERSLTMYRSDDVVRTHTLYYLIASIIIQCTLLDIHGIHFRTFCLNYLEHLELLYAIPLIWSFTVYGQVGSLKPKR